MQEGASLNVIIFGTGQLYKKNKYRFVDMNIVVFLDNDERKHGTMLDGVMVDKPENIIHYDFDYVILASKFFEQMREQLILLGVSQNVILDWEHRGDFENIRNIRSYNVKKELQDYAKKVLLVTHDMSLTGAPIVLLYMAKILEKNGYKVDVYSKTTGPLVFEFLKQDISVHIFDEFHFMREEVTTYFNEYNLVVINTVTLFKLVHEVEIIGIPIIWWLHEEDDVYQSYRMTKADLCVGKNVYIYGVGNRSISSYERYSGKRVTGELVYGIENIQNQKICKSEGKSEGNQIVFTIIGSVCDRKGHDVLLQVIVENVLKWRNYIEFWIIGAITEEYKKRFDKIENVKIWGRQTHEQVEKMYKQIDVVVCPSRNDPMPVVLAEGMMNRKLCIASDMTGTAELITPYEDGLICKAGDAHSLADCIQWVLDHKDKINTIGEKGYSIYEKWFSMESFENNVLRIISEKVK